MPYPAQIVASQTIPYGLGTHRAIDYCQNGVWWAMTQTSNTNVKFHYSTDQGLTWTFFQDFPIGDAIGGVSFFIDKDDYMHLVIDRFLTGIGEYFYYYRGTPNAGRTSYTWTYIWDFGMGDYAGGTATDVVAFRDPTSGWHMWATVAALYNSAPTWYTVVVHVVLNSSGTMTSQQIFNAGLITGNLPKGSIDFRHTASDPKAVQAATPSIYYMAIPADQASALYFVKFTYSGGVWSQGPLRQIDTAAQQYFGNLVYDGTRVLMAHIRFASLSQPRIDERDEADTTTTNRDPTDPADGAATNNPEMTVDPSGNIYLLWCGQTSQDVKKNVFNRAAGTWGGWTTQRAGSISTQTLGGTRLQPNASLLPLTYYDSATGQQLFDNLASAEFAGWGIPIR